MFLFAAGGSSFPPGMMPGSFPPGRGPVGMMPWMMMPGKAQAIASCFQLRIYARFCLLLTGMPGMMQPGMMNGNVPGFQGVPLPRAAPVVQGAATMALASGSTPVDDKVAAAMAAAMATMNGSDAPAPAPASAPKTKTAAPKKKEASKAPESVEPVAASTTEVSAEVVAAPAESATTVPAAVPAAPSSVSTAQYETHEEKVQAFKDLLTEVHLACVCMYSSGCAAFCE